MTDYYSDIRALIDPEQSGPRPEGGRFQEVSVFLTDDCDHGQLYWMTPAAVTLSADRARELAFTLLELAEHAQRLEARS